jgi:uncharacterized peroxidase-related enzyme
MELEPRIEPLSDEHAPPASRAILQQTKQAVGMVPNLYRTLAHAPVALRAYVETAATLAEGRLEPALREQIAVAVGGINRCEYCAAAHTAIGRGKGVDRQELTRNLSAESSDPKVAGALVFVRALLETRGAVSDAELRAVRDAGFSEADIVEIVGHVGMNAFSNMFNRLARTRIDFPRIELPPQR